MIKKIIFSICFIFMFSLATSYANDIYLGGDEYFSYYLREELTKEIYVYNTYYGTDTVIFKIVSTPINEHKKEIQGKLMKCQYEILVLRFQRTYDCQKEYWLDDGIFYLDRSYTFTDNGTYKLEYDDFNFSPHNHGTLVTACNTAVPLAKDWAKKNNKVEYIKD